MVADNNYYSCFGTCRMMNRRCMITVYSLIIVLLLLASICHSDDTNTLINNNNNNNESNITYDTNLTTNESSSSVSSVDGSSIDNTSIDGNGSSSNSSIDTNKTIVEEEDTNNPFVAMLGDTLYKWNNLERSEIVLESTVDLLAKKKVVGIYYSASWCPPCKQFTPLLVKFYELMNKNGEKFEIIWVSRDRNNEDFIAYYQKMPWLAVPVENMEAVTQLTSSKFKIQGIPHLVLLDGYDASIYTLEGTKKVMKDKYGLEFPYQPRSLLNLIPKSIKVLISQKIRLLHSQFKQFLYGLLEGFLPSIILKRLIRI